MPSIRMYCSSVVTLSKVYNAIYNGNSRHVSLRHRFIRQLIKSGTIKVFYVNTSRKLADLLTKPLTSDLVTSTTRFMGLKPQQNHLVIETQVEIGAPNSQV